MNEQATDSDYGPLVLEATGLAGEDLIRFWAEQLPYFCRDGYLARTLRPTEILRFHYETFGYVFDNYTLLEAQGIVPYSPFEEDRLIVACGRSKPGKRSRDDYRLRGWVGKTEHVFGKEWDKGHYIAHSLGGAVDGLESNVFVQRRDLNRGWSEEGKRFREMETYCFRHAGTFCFARPIYTDGTARPAFLDFGLLTLEGRLWIERFDNRSS